MKKVEEGEALFSDKYQGKRIFICIRMNNNWTKCGNSKVDKNNEM